MTKILVVKDARLDGSRPKGDEVLEVDEDTPLEWPVSWALGLAKKYHSEYVWLKLMAHGFETPGLALATGYSTSYQSTSTASQGGGGLQFCKDGVNLGTIKKFKPLFEWLDWVDIYSCGAAFITYGHEGKEGDGNVLCSRLAQTFGCPVRASTATQYYSSKGTDFGAWEGTVLTYGPRGNVIKVEHDPKE